MIIEHATRLKMQNHNVFLITRDPVESKQLAWHPAATEVAWLTLDDAKKRRFDFIFATWWQSVFLLEHLSAANYFYFIQSIESRFFPPEDKAKLDTRDIDVLRMWCESTYRYPLPVVTEAKWIRRYLKEHYNRDAYMVRNGIRKDLYRPDGPAVAPRKQGALRVLIEGPLGVAYKNVAPTIELCQQANVDEIWLLTSSDVSGYPGVDRCFSQVPINKTPDIYRSCDVLVKLSYVEGMFGPPLEMFHCGGTAVVYDVTGHDEYIKHNTNGLVVKQDCEDDVVECLMALKNKSGLIEKLKKEALLTADKWPDWSESTRQLEMILEKFNPRFDAPPAFLSEHSHHYLENRENAFRACEIHRMAAREQVRDAEAKSFQNFIQVYFHGGEGFSNEKMCWETYPSGDWEVCEVAIPGDSTITHVRVDPSVRIGVVRIKSLRLINAETGLKILGWGPGESWEDVKIAGTAVALCRKPFPVINCFGEDPQLVLPAVDSHCALRVMIELQEMSYTQALSRYSSLCQTKKTTRFLENLRCSLSGNR